MSKKLSLILVAIFIFLLIFIQSDSFKKATSSSVYTTILSTDGNIYPGQKQDFIFTIFKNNKGERVLESHANFGIKFSYSLDNGAKKKSIIPLLYNLPGKYICNFEFPENMEESNVEITIFQDSRTDCQIMKCNIPVKRERAIVVQPPVKQVYTGDKVCFKLASLEKKSGLSQFKIPIRIRLIPPSGYTTVNRIVTTDTEGLATFETKIHKASPEGFYTFIFQSETFEQRVLLYVKKEKDGNLSNDTETLYTPINDEENKGFIFNLNCERNSILLAYGCPESEFRQIEIWQNGKLHYFSNLPLEGGIISLPLHRPLLAGCPTLFKVWQIKDNLVSSSEKVRYIASKNRSKVNTFLTDVNFEFQNTEKDKLAAAFSRKGFIGTSPNVNSKNLTKVFTSDLKAVNLSSQNEIPLSYYESFLKETNEEFKSDYIFIEDKYKINNAESCRIFLDSNEFLQNYIEDLNTRELVLNNLLQECICRTDRFQFLNLQEKKNEIEEIESLLIPISELYNYLNKFPNEKKKYAPLILSCVLRMKEIVFIPAELNFDLSQKQYDLNLLPMLDIVPYARSFQSIQGILKPEGKIKLSNDNSSKIIELDDRPSDIKIDNYDSIENLRSLPLLIKIK